MPSSSGPDMHGSQFIELLAAHAEDGDRTYAPRRYQVASVSAGLVTLKEVVTGEVIDEPFAALLGPAYTVGMEVMAIPVGEAELFVLGPVMRATPTLLQFGGDFVGQVYFNANDSVNSNNNSNPSTTNWVDSLTLSLSVPNGTYDALVVGSSLMGHDTSGSVNLRLTCEGTSDSGITSPNLTTANVTRIVTANKFSNVTVSDGTINVLLEYKANTAGGASGASARQNHIEIVAQRVG